MPYEYIDIEFAPGIIYGKVRGQYRIMKADDEWVSISLSAVADAAPRTGDSLVILIIACMAVLSVGLKIKRRIKLKL